MSRLNVNSNSKNLKGENNSLPYQSFLCLGVINAGYFWTKFWAVIHMQVHYLWNEHWMLHEVLNISQYHKTIANFVVSVSTLGNNYLKKLPLFEQLWSVEKQTFWVNMMMISLDLKRMGYFLNSWKETNKNWKQNPSTPQLSGMSEIFGVRSISSITPLISVFVSGIAFTRLLANSWTNNMFSNFLKHVSKITQKYSLTRNSNINRVQQYAKQDSDA